MATDTTTKVQRDRAARQELDKAVAAAQAGAIEPGKAETQAARDKRLARDRKVVEDRNEAVRLAQVQLHGVTLDDDGQFTLKPEELTPAERDARRQAARDARKELDQTVVEAVAAENAARAEAIANA